MKILIILILAQVTNGAYRQITIEEHPGCDNVPDTIYHVEPGIMCLPVDVIFLGGFE